MVANARDDVKYSGGTVGASGDAHALWGELCAVKQQRDRLEAWVRDVVPILESHARIDRCVCRVLQDLHERHPETYRAIARCNTCKTKDLLAALPVKDGGP